MFKIIDSLKRLIGRFVKMYSSIFIQYGVMLIPMASVLWIFSVDQKGWFGWAMLGVGTIFFIIGMISLRWASRSAKEEAEEERERRKIELEKFRAEINALLLIRNDITKSIDSLTNEIRQERNERNTKPKSELFEHFDSVL
jgi:hypothetical protein